jgi:hypothetical protein
MMEIARKSLKTKFKIVATKSWIKYSGNAAHGCVFCYWLSVLGSLTPDP